MVSNSVQAKVEVTITVLTLVIQTPQPVVHLPVLTTTIIEGKHKIN